MGWTESPMVVFMSTMLGVGIAIIILVIQRHAQRNRTPRTVADWLPALEQANMGVVHASSHLAERVKDLVVLRDKMPPECQRIADQVLHYTQVVEEQLFEELAQRGIVPRYMFGGPVSDLRRTYETATVLNAVSADVSTEDDVARQVIDEPNVIQLNAPAPREWVGRQLLRRPGS